MAYQYVKSKTVAHSQIAQNIHICMRLLEKFGETLNWKKMNEIRSSGDDCLKAAIANAGRGVNYSEYSEATKQSHTLMSQVWGVMLQDSSLDVVAPWVNTLKELADKIEEDAESVRNEEGMFVIPAVENRMMELREKLVGADEGNMTPLARLNHNRDLQSLGAGLDAATFVRQSINDLQEGQDRQVQVSGLNVEVVNEQILRSWMISVGRKGALPKDPSIIMGALDHVSKYRHADEDARTRFYEAWEKACPFVDEGGLKMATSAVLASAASNRLESLEGSSVDVVRKIVEEVYEEREMDDARAAMANGDQLSGRADAEEIKQIEPLLSSLHDQLIRVFTERKPFALAEG